MLAFSVKMHFKYALVTVVWLQQHISASKKVENNANINNYKDRYFPYVCMVFQFTFKPVTITTSIWFHFDRYLNSIDKQIEEAFLENEIPCLDDQYQKYQKRPQRHTVINVQIGFLGVYSLSTSNMDWKADLYLYQKWSDVRCKFDAKNNQTTLTIYTRPNGKSHKGLQNMWQPDTHILNAKSSNTTEIVTHITNRGMVSSFNNGISRTISESENDLLIVILLLLFISAY